MPRNRAPRACPRSALPSPTVSLTVPPRFRKRGASARTRPCGSRGSLPSSSYRVKPRPRRDRPAGDLFVPALGHVAFRRPGRADRPVLDQQRPAAPAADFDGQDGGPSKAFPAPEIGPAPAGSLTSRRERGHEQEIPEQVLGSCRCPTPGVGGVGQRHGAHHRIAVRDASAALEWRYGKSR
jgi:hypothetical protein